MFLQYNLDASEVIKTSYGEVLYETFQNFFKTMKLQRIYHVLR